MGMLARQGAHALSLWLKVKPDIELMRTAAERALTPPMSVAPLSQPMTLEHAVWPTVQVAGDLARARPSGSTPTAPGRTRARRSRS